MALQKVITQNNTTTAILYPGNYQLFYNHFIQNWGI